MLGGTSEASALARRLANEPGVAATLSLAGATARPAPAPIPRRIGGFGGPEGLAAYLKAERIQAVIDATHPFAARMSANALTACGAAGAALLVFTRGPWTPLPGDFWTEVAAMGEAVAALGSAPRIVFLSQGRLGLAAFAQAPQHRYLVRAIDPPAGIEALPEHKLVLARGPFALEEEIALMREEGIEIVVAKNSGGQATYPKIEAARRLGLPVVLVKRPKPPEAETLFELDAVLAWIAARRGEL